jgi:hypothetical protein
MIFSLSLAKVFLRASAFSFSFAMLLLSFLLGALFSTSLRCFAISSLKV